MRDELFKQLMQHSLTSAHTSLENKTAQNATPLSFKIKQIGFVLVNGDDKVDYE